MSVLSFHARLIRRSIALTIAGSALALVAGCASVASRFSVVPARAGTPSQAYIVPAAALADKSPQQVPGFISANFDPIQLPARPILMEDTDYYIVPRCGASFAWNAGTNHRISPGDPVVVHCPG